MDPLHIAIDAQISPAKAGGVSQAIIGLVHALGQLDDSDERYAVVISKEEADWLKPFIGPNQRLIVRAQASKSPMRELVKKKLYPLWKKVRQVESVKSSAIAQSQVTNSFLKRLGCQVLHIPHQHFTFTSLPTIYTPHDLQHVHYPQFFTQAQFEWRERVYGDGCRLSKVVIAASQWVKDDLIQHFQLDAKKVQVIPWGVPTLAYAAPSPDTLVTVRDKYQLEQNFIFFPAVTWPHKNHIRLLEAIAQLRDHQNIKVNLVCTGSQYQPFWPTIEKQISALNLGEQVKFLGFVPDVDLRAIYRLAQCLVMPTLFESDSFPIYEAWLEGTPVICSNVTSLPVQVMDAAILFDPNDTASIANAIATADTNAQVRQELTKRGYQRLKDFNWEQTAKAYRALYRQTAGRALTDEDKHLLSWDWMMYPQRQIATVPLVP